MNHAKPLLSLLAAGFMLTGCSGYSTKSASNEDYQKSLNEAVIVLDNAQKSGFEWRDSRDILKDAEKAAKDGDFAMAIELISKAKRQGELALIQAQKPISGPHI